MKEDTFYEVFPVFDVVMHNVLNLSMFILGSLVVGYFHFSLGILFFIFCLITIVWMLKKKCTCCHYYGKRCVIGLGLIASFLFTEGRKEDFNTSFWYAVPITFIPIVLGILLLIFRYSHSLLIVFVLYLMTIVISILIPKFAPDKEQCLHCKQKTICQAGKIATNKKTLKSP